VSRQQDGQETDQAGEEGDEEEEGLDVDGDVGVDADGVGVRYVAHLEDGDDDEEDGDDCGDDDERRADDGEERGPPEFGVSGAHEPLGEEKVDDVEDDGAHVDEDLGGEGELVVGGVEGPGGAKGGGEDADETEGCGPCVSHAGELCLSR